MLLNSCLRFPSIHPPKHSSYLQHIALQWGRPLCCVHVFTHTHTHTHALSCPWCSEKKPKRQTTARGDFANLLLTCENELPRLITWQRLDHSCQLTMRVVCQWETKPETSWKGFSFYFFSPFSLLFSLWEISPTVAIIYYLPCSCVEALWTWSIPMLG